MPFVKGVEEESATGPLAEMFAADRKSWGYVPNLALTFGLRPEVYQAWRQLNGAIKASMDPRRYELATVAAAVELESSYCSLAHGRAASIARQTATAVRNRRTSVPPSRDRDAQARGRWRSTAGVSP